MPLAHTPPGRQDTEGEEWARPSPPGDFEMDWDSPRAVHGPRPPAGVAPGAYAYRASSCDSYGVQHPKVAMGRPSESTSAGACHGLTQWDLTVSNALSGQSQAPCVLRSV